MRVFPKRCVLKASLIFSWKDAEAVSRIEKQFSEHKALHVSTHKCAERCASSYSMLNVHEHVYKNRYRNLFSAKDAISKIITIPRCLWIFLRKL